jgi:hypothetical protein
MWLSRPGAAVPNFAIGPFPQATRRTRHACCHATGSPRHLPLGVVGDPGVRDLGAAVPVSGDRDLGEVEELDPVRRGSGPPAVWAGVVSTDVPPFPAVQFPKPRITLCHTKFSSALMVSLATARRK